MSIATSHEDIIPAPFKAALPYLLLALAAFLTYANIYDNSLLFDDDLLITLNSYIADWHHIPDILVGSTTSGAHIMGGFYRPVQMLAYLFVQQVLGGGTFWFHLLNLTVHIGNGCLMYRLGTKLGFRPGGVFLATLIWILHPLHVEAVTYMSATADPLFAFFCLSAIVYLLPDISVRKIWCVIPLFLLALGTKETSAMFPLLVMVCLFFANSDRLNFRIYLRTWPLWVISLVFVYWRATAPGFDGPQTYSRFYGLHEFANLALYAQHPAYRLYTFFATLPAYLKLLLLPEGLHMERAFSIYTDPSMSPVIAGAVIVAISLLAFASSCRKIPRCLPASWGILWFYAAHGPDSGLLVPMNSLFLEHWMYLPTVGLFLGLAESVARLCENQPRWLGYGFGMIALLFALFLSGKTYAQNKVWYDGESFYLNIFAYGEQSARSHNNLALYYSAHDRYDEADKQFRLATKISDTYAETRYNMAINDLRFLDQAHIDKALADVDRALEIDPKFYRAWQMKGDIYARLQNDPGKAAIYYAKSRELYNPNLPQ
jgi:tetratricopeptide (TPR) repeat protein